MAELGTVEHLAEEVRRIWEDVPPSARSCIQEVQNATRFIAAEYAIHGLESAMKVALAHQAALDNRYGEGWPDLPIVRQLLRTQCTDRFAGRQCPQDSGHVGLHGQPGSDGPWWLDFGVAGWRISAANDTLEVEVWSE